MNDDVEDGMGFSGFAPDPFEDRQEPRGHEIADLAYKDGVKAERADTEALARELGKKVRCYTWQHSNYGSGKEWRLQIMLQVRHSPSKFCYAPTQPQCVQQALELLKGDS